MELINNTTKTLKWGVIARWKPYTAYRAGKPEKANRKAGKAGTGWKTAEEKVWAGAADKKIAIYEIN